MSKYKVSDRVRIMGRTFRLRHDTPELKKGVIVEYNYAYQRYFPQGEEQDYRHDDLKQDRKRYGLSPKTVETMPYWFEEVFSLTPKYGTKTELKTIELLPARKTKKERCGYDD